MNVIKKARTKLSEDGVTEFFYAAARYCERRAGKFIFSVSSLYTNVFARRDNLWVFTDNLSDRPFKQNSKYLYLYLANNQDNNINPIWVTENDNVYTELVEYGYPVSNMKSITARICTLQSDCIFTDSYIGAHLWPYTGGATKIQMGHGIPLKADRDYNDLSKLDSLEKSDYMLYSSKECESHFKQWDSNSENPLPEVQSVRSGTAIHAGYPRTDVFFRNINGAKMGESMDALKQVYSFTDQGNVIGYFPTFRDKEFEFSDAFNVDQLQIFLNRHDQKLVISPHKLLNIGEDVLETERIHIAKPELDSHLFLDRIDILITDYSSIYFDYLLLDRPVVFYTPDYSTYQEIRGVHPNYENVIAGPRVDDFDGLLDQLESIVNGVDEYANRREEIRDQFFEHADGNACERIVKELSDYNQK